MPIRQPCPGCKGDGLHVFERETSTWWRVELRAEFVRELALRCRHCGARMLIKSHVPFSTGKAEGSALG
jgi:hypothetical protein